jgi:murein DD-endopeptidase MepM/ murein hydrolase activator NlpD
MTSPLPGYTVTTPYGKPGSWAAGYHTGNDYAAPSGTAVVATRAGKVTKSQWDGDYGNRVEILTGDIEHSYSHLSAMAVWVGDPVAEGQQIGRVGSTGNSTGPHLHYEERHAPYGYNDDRIPQFDTTTGTDEWPEQPSREEDGDEDGDDMLAIVAPSGAAYLIIGAARAHGIHDGDDAELERAGVPVAHVNQKTFDSFLAGRS